MNVERDGWEGVSCFGLSGVFEGFGKKELGCFRCSGRYLFSAFNSWLYFYLLEHVKKGVILVFFLLLVLKFSTLQTINYLILSTIHSKLSSKMMSRRHSRIICLV